MSSTSCRAPAASARSFIRKSRSTTFPGLPIVTGQELTDNLLKQIEPFHPTFHFNEMVETLTSLGTPEKPAFRLTTDAGKIFMAKVVDRRGRRRLVPAQEAADPDDRAI